MAVKVTLINGDGIGPEVTTAARRIIDASGVKIDWEVCEAGANVAKEGGGTGIPKETADSIARNGVALKGPLGTPIGPGGKSTNVALRKMFETYGNIRPTIEIPGVITPYSGRGIDFVIVRENVEDLYAGIEYMQSPGVAQCLKLISRKGCEKISRLAFEFARSQGRKEVICTSKATIMQLTEGLLKRTYEDISKDYPDITTGHLIVDNCAHQLVKNPEKFDVIVTTNMNGDILSDLSSALIGGLGFAPGANIGDHVAIFEAVHGTAPKYAGKNVINPTAVLLSGVMMLRHLGEFAAAETIEDALFLTFARDKKYTRDIAGDQDAVSTTDFTDAVIANLGSRYENKKHHNYTALHLPKVAKDFDFVKVSQRRVTGLDVFIETTQELKSLGTALDALVAETPFQLKLIANRGMKVYPGEARIAPELTDVMRCRFIARNQDEDVSDELAFALFQRVAQHHRWTHIEKLHEFEGKAAYSKSHGEE
ncbi:MAG: NADP-dependent isocitrate dehydrogenase [Alphaproteobacteria bacterium]